MKHEHKLSPLQKGDLEVRFLSKDLLEKLRVKSGADAIFIIATKGNSIEIRSYGLCGHEIIHLATDVIEHGLELLNEGEDEEEDNEE